MRNSSSSDNDNIISEQDKARDNSLNGEPLDNEWEIALRQAIDWTIIIDDDPKNTKVKEQFSKWINSSNINKKAWGEATHVSNIISQTKGISIFPATKKTKNKMPFISFSAKFAAPIAAMFLLGWISLPQIMLYVNAEHVTSTKEQKTLALEDGSSIRLAPGSAVKVVYDNKNRNVNLIKGEAYFEVTHNPSRPFHVKTQNANVTVLGTGFDVRIGADIDEIGVRHGRVKVEDAENQNANSKIITNGEWLRVTEDGEFTNGITSPELIGSWSENSITATNRPLADVISDLRRYYNGTIIIMDKNISSRSVTGVFDVTNPAQAAQLIVQPHGGNVRRITPWILLISAA